MAIGICRTPPHKPQQILRQSADCTRPTSISRRTGRPRKSSTARRDTIHARYASPTAAPLSRRDNYRFNDHAEQADVAFFASVGRAGIAWGADAQWTDATSIEDAINRYLSDDMVS